jgi:signal transduction histidine kinase
VLDYLNGPEVSLSVFYLMPVCLAVWFVGTKFGVFTAVFGSIAWMIADLVSGARYAHFATPYWNTIVRICMLLITASLLDRLKVLQLDLEERVNQRTAALNAEIARREQLERELLAAADRERERIGRDLHDGLGQHLAAAAGVSLSLEENAEARKITQLINQAIADTRLLARGLYPAALEIGGLSIALEQLCSAVKPAFGIECRFVCSFSVVTPDRSAAEHLFRIAQEAVTNAVKHASPQCVVVGLTAVDDSVTLIVKDDGRGMAKQPPAKRGMGLHIMMYRAKLIGGQLDIESEPGSGTLVTCVAPLRAELTQVIMETNRDATNEI